MTTFGLALQSLRARLFQRAPAVVTRSSLRTLEVERKFAPTKESISRLRKNDGSPPFQSHIFMGRKVIKDFYLDSGCGSVIKNGIYVRVRNGEFEAKIRQGGNYTNSTSQEVSGEEEVRKVVATAVPNIYTDLDELLPFGWMRTLRDEWEVDGFKVVVDKTLFGAWAWGRPTYPQMPHIVGEVELCQAIGSECGEGMGGKIDQRIKEFMRKHHWAFPTSEEQVEGKLVAYDKWSMRT